MLDTWDEPHHSEEEDEGDDDCQASLSYNEIRESGQPARPLEFPTPVVYEGGLADVTARDHLTGTEYHLKNVLRRRGDTAVAYVMKKKLAKSTYGSVRLGVVLRRIPQQEDNDGQLFRAKWMSTGELVAIKCSSWAKIQAMRGRTLVDPIKEISALQLFGPGSSDHHVMGCNEVLQDDDHLYTVMPYCGEGDLYGRLDISGLQLCPDEDEARLYFGHLLKSLLFLQRKGVCHRNICLENLLLNEQQNLILIDAGLAIRVPYSDPCTDGVTDVSEGSIRRLMRAQGQCGKLMYLAPEIIDQRDFDGHTTDLWSAGIVLFIMLVGVAPFSLAQSSDKRFESISRGGLKDMLRSLDMSLSPEAVDLLQNMLWRKPQDRLTLAEVMEHPWVRGERFPVIESPKPTVDLTLQVDPFSKAPNQGESAAVSSDEHSIADEVSEPSTGTVENDRGSMNENVSPTRTHRRKRSSGAKEIIGKLKFMIGVQKKRASGADSAGRVSATNSVA